MTNIEEVQEDLRSPLKIDQEKNNSGRMMMMSNER